MSIEFGVIQMWVIFPGPSSSAMTLVSPMANLAESALSTGLPLVALMDLPGWG